MNAFVGNVFTSSAGNHYFNLLRFAKGILIKEDVGQGYKYTFLNGLKIYSVKEKTLIADASFHNVVYNTNSVKNVARQMLLEKLSEAAEQQGFGYNRIEAESLVKQIVEEAFVIDQRTVAEQQLKRLGS